MEQEVKSYSKTNEFVIQGMLNTIKYHEEAIQNLHDKLTSITQDELDGAEIILNRICYYCNTNKTAIKSGDRKTNTAIAKRIFILMIIHFYGWDFLRINYGSYAGFKKSNIHSMLQKKSWMFDSLLSIPLKKVMLKLEVKKIHITIPGVIKSLDISIDDL